jgi:broad specificity phosphatase PhoE
MDERRQRLILVRHGETEWSREGRHTGRSDIELTDTGRRQAVLTGEALAAYHFAAVFTSPLRRAVTTCVLAGFGDRAVLCDALCEWDYGAYEGLTTAEIRERRPGWSLWGDGVVDGETVDEVGARADSVIARAKAIDGDVALFAHGHVLRILAARWLGLAAVGGRMFVLSTATISVLGYEREEPAVLRWNDDSHLRAPVGCAPS